MPYSDYRPDLMGSANIEPSGAFEAGSYQSFTLTYTCGAFGIDDTGSIKIGFRFATDFGPVQFNDPKEPGYTTAEASNGATLELKWEFKRNIRPWSRSLYIGVMKDFLAPGDTIIIRFGDRRTGSPGIRVQTYCESEFEFRVLADPIATYDYVAISQSPKIAVVPGPPVSWHAVLPTLVRSGDPFRIAIKADDKWRNPSNLAATELSLISSAPIMGLPTTVLFEPGKFSTIIPDLKVTEQTDLTIRVYDKSGKLLCRSNPMRVTAKNTQHLHFWGDTHGQSNETLGTNTAREYFEFGRDKAFLDVMGHQGNDFQITGAFWKELNRMSQKLDQPGRFVCIPGYEWSANTAVGGDRNVHFRHEDESIYRSSHAQVADPVDMKDEGADAHDAHALFEKLKDKDCVVVAHVGGRYADILYAHDPKLETAVEVHSAWGTFEWIIRDAFDKGYRVGIVANSDGHKGRPGACYPGASFFGSQGGLTCFVAPRLDRDSIFEAMRRRHHYASTGNRLFLDVKVYATEGAELFNRDPGFDSTVSAKTNELMMGDIARVASDSAELQIEVIGSAPIERIDIFDGLELIETRRPFDTAALGNRIRLGFRGAEYRGRARATTWDGTLTVTDNAITRTSVVNNWNLDRGIQRQDTTSVTWKAVTTGNHGAIDLWMRKRSGRIGFTTKPISAEMKIADIGLEETIFDAGGLERAVTLQRLPDAMTQTRLTHRRDVKIRAQGDSRLYVRVTQEDGHRAWSSPIYLFRR